MFIMNNKKQFFAIAISIILVSIVAGFVIYHRDETSPTNKNTISGETVKNSEDSDIVYFTKDRAGDIDAIVDDYISNHKSDSVRRSSYLANDWRKETYTHNTGATGFKISTTKMESANDPAPCDTQGVVETDFGCFVTHSSSTPVTILFLEGGYSEPILSLVQNDRLQTVDESITSLPGYIESFRDNIPLTQVRLIAEAENYHELSLEVTCEDGVEVYLAGKVDRGDMCDQNIAYSTSDRLGYNKVSNPIVFYVLNEKLKSVPVSAEFTLVAKQRNGEASKSQKITTTVDPYLSNQRLSGVKVFNDKRFNLNNPNDLPKVFAITTKEKFGTLAALKSMLDPRYAMLLMEEQKKLGDKSCYSSIATCVKNSLDRLEVTNYESIKFLDDVAEHGEDNGVVEQGDLYTHQPVHLVGVPGAPSDGIVRFVFKIRETYDEGQKNAKYTISGIEMIPYGTKWKLF